MCRVLMMSAALVLSACGDLRSPSRGQSADGDSLAGAWRSQVRFNGGALAGMKDLEFMYVFNAGGTMTESSNYDGAPPVPPAYGVWRKNGPRQFEVRYEFYITRARGEWISRRRSEDSAQHGALMPMRPPPRGLY